MWWYLIVLILLFGMLLLSSRNRRRQMAAQTAAAERIVVGTEVMTTSGLYGTVVAKADDGTVTLAVAPGVEVKWALAALREPETLPHPYRRGFPGRHDTGHGPETAA